jgi:hypothetical protein
VRVKESEANDATQGSWLLVVFSPNQTLIRTLMVPFTQCCCYIREIRNQILWRKVKGNMHIYVWRVSDCIGERDV